MTCQRVGVCGKLGSGWEQQWCPQRLFSKGELGKDLVCATAQPTRREDCGHDLLQSVPHGLIKGVQSMVDYQHQPGTTPKSGGCWPQGAGRAEGWKPGNCDYCSPVEPPSLWNHRKRKIQSPAIWKTYKTSLAGVKSTGGFFFPRVRQ